MYYFIVFALLLILELIYFWVAGKFNIIDKPNERSSHTRITLRGGGIVFYLGALVYFLFSGFEYPWFILGLSGIALVSFIDDIHSLPDGLRLVVQFAAMFLMFYQFGILDIRDWWIIIIALIVCTGILNAYNFMDGINGITGGYSLAVLVPLVCLNANQQFIDPAFLYVMGLSLLVFCFFNFRKRAKCFAGDVGSLSMAFLVLFALGRLILQTGDFTYIVFLAVYGVDTVLTICHRIQLHENLGQAHRKHAYQLMANELQIPHVLVSAFYAGLQLLVSLGMVLLPVNHWGYAGAVVTGLSICYILFMRRFYPLHETYLRTQRL